MFRVITLVASIAALSVLPAVASGGEKGDLEVGLFAGYGFPDSYGEGSAELDPDDDLLYGIRLGYFLTPHWSLELSNQLFSTETQLVPTPATGDLDVDITSVRLNLLYNFRPERGFRPFLTFGAGLENTDVDTLFDDDDAGSNFGGGLRWFVSDRFGLRLDARYVSTDVGGVVNDSQDNVEGTFGMLWAFGGGPPPDSDGDGVPDRRDACPATPRGARVDERGCPIDTDRDGVPDGIDKCPNTAAGVPVDASGCPRDSDGDGVHDGNDRCPGTPRGARVDAKGCPTDADGDGVYDGIDECSDTPAGARVDARGCPTDSDGDGVYDGIDKCPGTPQGTRVDRTGCAADSDGDGVTNDRDACPGTPRGTRVDAKGCELVFETARQTLVLEGVHFEVDSAQLTPDSRTILDRVAQSLQAWPEIRVEVSGHTDSTGSDRYNLSLSERRAESVRRYLIDRGVDASRMTARGYGESRPIESNETTSGRRKNRRVELRKLE